MSYPKKSTKPSIHHLIDELFGDKDHLKKRFEAFAASGVPRGVVLKWMLDHIRSGVVVHEQHIQDTESKLIEAQDEATEKDLQDKLEYYKRELEKYKKVDKAISNLKIDSSLFLATETDNSKINFKTGGPKLSF